MLGSHPVDVGEDASAEIDSELTASMESQQANGVHKVVAPRPEETPIAPGTPEYELHVPVTTGVHPDDLNTKDDWITR
jgi:hypothetical protein